MAIEDEIKGLSRFLLGLGFPLGLIAVIGAFSLGVAIFHNEISLNSKRLVLGVFLISISAFAHYFPKIYARSSFTPLREDPQRYFSFRALTWAGLFGWASYYFGYILIYWP